MTPPHPCHSNSRHPQAKPEGKAGAECGAAAGAEKRCRPTRSAAVWYFWAGCQPTLSCCWFLKFASQGSCWQANGANTRCSIHHQLQRQKAGQGPVLRLVLQGLIAIHVPSVSCRCTSRHLAQRYTQTSIASSIDERDRMDQQKKTNYSRLVKQLPPTATATAHHAGHQRHCPQC